MKRWTTSNVATPVRAMFAVMFVALCLMSVHGQAPDDEYCDESGIPTIGGSPDFTEIVIDVESKFGIGDVQLEIVWTDGGEDKRIQLTSPEGTTVYIVPTGPIIDDVRLQASHMDCFLSDYGARFAVAPRDNRCFLAPPPNYDGSTPAFSEFFDEAADGEWVLEILTEQLGAEGVLERYCLRLYEERRSLPVLALEWDNDGDDVEVAWTNAEDYDEIQVFVNSELHGTVLEDLAEGDNETYVIQDPPSPQLMSIRLVPYRDGLEGHPTDCWAPVIGPIELEMCSEPDIFWIPEDGPAFDTISVEDEFEVSDLIVEVDLEGLNGSQNVRVVLESPAGTEVTLQRLCRSTDTEGCGGSDEFLFHVSPDDYGVRTRYWSQGRRYFPFFDQWDYVQPSQHGGDLGDFFGETAEGEWTLSFWRPGDITRYEDDELILHSWCLTFLEDGPGALAVDNLTCVALAKSGAFEASWTNRSDYDVVRVFIDDEIIEILDGPFVAGEVSSANISIEPFPSYGRITVQGLVNGAPGPKKFCRVRTEALAGLSCSSEDGSGLIDVDWVSLLDFEEIRVYVNGCLDATLPGDTTSHTTEAYSVPTAATITVEAVIDSEADTAAVLECRAMLLDVPRFELCESPDVVVESQSRETFVIDVSDEFAVGNVDLLLEMTGGGAWGGTVELVSPGGVAVMVFDSFPTATLPDLVFGDRGFAYETTDLDCECYMQPYGPGDFGDLRGEPSAGAWELRAINVNAYAIEFTVLEWCLRLGERCDGDIPLLTCVEVGAGVELSWSGLEGFDRVEVFRGTKLLEVMTDGDEVYLDSDAASGRLQYRVAGVTEDSGCEVLSARCVVERGLLEVCEELALPAEPTDLILEFATPFTGTVEDIEVFIDLTNLLDEDDSFYSIVLESPAGTRVDLLSDPVIDDADLRWTATDSGVPFAHERLASDVRMQPKLPTRLRVFRGEEVVEGDPWTLSVDVDGEGATLEAACIRIYESLCELSPPTGMTCSVDGGDLELAWESGDASSIEIIVDGAVLDTVDGELEEYLLESVLPGVRVVELVGSAEGESCLTWRLRCEVEVEIDWACEEPGVAVGAADEVTTDLFIEDEGVVGAVDVSLALPTLDTSLWRIVVESPSATEVVLHDGQAIGAGFDLIFSDAGIPATPNTLIDRNCACRIQPQGPGALAELEGEEVSGVWSLTLAQESGGGESLLESWCLGIATGCEAPIDVGCQSSAGEVELTWENGAEYDSVDVLRDGVLVAALEGDAESYVDGVTAAGRYRYRVVGVSGTCRSPSSECAAVSGALTVRAEVPPGDCRLGPDTLSFSSRFRIGSIEVALRADVLDPDHRIELESPWGTRVVLTERVSGLPRLGVDAVLDATFVGSGPGYTLSGLGKGDPMLALGPGSLADLAGEVSHGPQPWALHHEGVANLVSWEVALFPAVGEEVEPPFRRGDVDGTGDVSALPDALFLFRYGFTDGPEPPCMDAADVDDRDGVSALPDGLFLLRWGFVEDALPPPSPGVLCGVDPTTDDLGCESPNCP